MTRMKSGPHRRTAGRPLSPETAELFALLEDAGLMSLDELTEASGIPKEKIRHRLWWSLQHGNVELLYSITEEGKKSLKRFRLGSS